MFTHTHTHRGKQVKWRTYKLNGRNNYGTAVDVRVCSAQLFGRGRHRLIRKRNHIFPALRQLIMLSRVWLFVTLWTVACQAPPSMGFSGKNTGLGCHFLLQRIFLTQESSPRLLHLLHCRQILYPEPSGKPIRWQPTGRTDDEAAKPLQAVRSWRSRQEPSDSLASWDPLFWPALKNQIISKEA